MDDLRRELAHAAEDLAYTAVGFAVLGFQRVQVARRDLERRAPVVAWTEQVRAAMSGREPDPRPPGDGADREEPGT